MNSVKKAAKLFEAQRSGALTDIPLNAVNTDSPPLLYGPNETLSYVLHGIFPSYGIATRLLEEIKETLPHWQPTSMLDFGSGPGTAVFAAKEQWPDTLFDFTVVEPSRSMMQVAEHLLVNTPGVMYRRSLLEAVRLGGNKRYDLIVAHYTLAGLTSDKEREDALAQMWDLLAPGGVLLLSEHGDR